MGRSLFNKLKLVLYGLLCGYIGLYYLLSGLYLGSGYMVVFDVGQGDSILIVTSENHQILIDGGLGGRVVEKLGKYMGYFDRSLDLVVLSHPHKDHVEGLNAVLKRYEVENILINGLEYYDNSYEEFLRRIKDEGAAVYYASADQDFAFGEVVFDTIYPFDRLEGGMEEVNNSSIVLRVEIEGLAVLLTGDAEIEVERELLQKVLKTVDVLKVGHHGSKTSSSEEFLEMIAPEVAVISCGRDNRFGHPSEEVLQRFDERGIDVRRTDLEGDIVLFF